MNTKQFEPYPVVAIPDTLDTREQRGTRTKFWVRIGEDESRWLLKIPRPEVGEHWAENVVAEVGGLIGVECAQVEWAEYAEHAVLAVGERRRLDNQPEETHLATICKSFLPREYDGDATYYVFHGWEVMQFEIDGYDTNLRFGQRDHNIRNTSAALTKPRSVKTLNSMPRWEDTLEHLASYALLDGLVGNTDRHHENWMTAYMVDSGNAFVEELPSFDHASSLGRELSDARRCRILNSGEVRRYLERGRGSSVC